MTDFITRQLQKLIGGALAPVEAAGTRLLGTAGFGLVAIACLIAAIAFLSVALDQWLAQLWGPALAALAVAGFYLVIVGICLMMMRARSSRKPSLQAPPVQPAMQSDAAANIEESIAPFVAILHDSGLKREEVAVRLGTEVAKQLGPVALIATALVAGFILQRSLEDSKKKPQ